MRKAIVLLLLFLLSCVVNVDYRIYEKRLALPLMGVNGAEEVGFYLVKRISLNEFAGLSIKEAYFNFTARSTKNMEFKIMVQDTGPDVDTKIYAVCWPPWGPCSAVYSVYEKAPDYIMTSPRLIYGSVYGEKEFERVVPDAGALGKIESAFEKGKIWIIVNVSTNNPSYFTPKDSLYIEDLEGTFKIEKDVMRFAGISGGVF